MRNSCRNVESERLKSRALPRILESYPAKTPFDTESPFVTITKSGQNGPDSVIITKRAGDCMTTSGSGVLVLTLEHLFDLLMERG